MPQILEGLPRVTGGRGGGLLPELNRQAALRTAGPSDRPDSSGLGRQGWRNPPAGTGGEHGAGAENVAEDEVEGPAP